MIHERTYLTTATEIRKLLEIERRHNRLDHLYWFVEVKLPGSRTRSGKPVLQAACWPKEHVPVIPVGCDPDTSRHWAEMLKALFEDGNAGTGIEHALALTNAERMEGLDWYEWGQEFDCICETCGAVFKDTAPNAEYSCCGGWRD